MEGGRRDFFQLPLSGSHAVENVGGLVEDQGQTFNSLSRDHVTWFDAAEVHIRTFLSTPSLGITGSQRTGRLLSFPVPIKSFQLPLSGSPSPIPGFFGSPRLSAAAALRTNDF